jgi:hypothetical protein
MKRIKSTLEDEQLLVNESANPADRASAAESLASDGLIDIVSPILKQWLEHSEPMLREEAITLLLGGFGYEQYVEKAILMLHNDPYWLTRGDAAFALSSFATRFKSAEKYKDKIIKELLRSLISEEDKVIQRKSYQSLYEIITTKLLQFDKDEFDRNCDIDWNLLQPYLDKYGLQKPDKFN